MEYKEAKKIRGKSFGTLLAEHEGGLGSSISAAISQKTQAKMAGMKEKFDPMNIAKFMTGGSNWAPAMLGKLTGRKQSSIDYFSGVKRRGKGTAEKIGSSKGGTGGDFLGILHSIETLLHKTREDDKLKHEQDKNFEEERNLEKARRHKELMVAITGKPYKETATTTAATTTATKVDEDDKPKSFLDDLGDLKNIFSLLKGARWLLMALASPAGMIAALLAAGIAGMILQFRNTDQAAKEGDVGKLKQALRQQMTGPNGEPAKEEDINDAVKSVLKIQADKGSAEAKQSLEMMEKNPNTLGVTGPTSYDDLRKSYLTSKGKDESTATEEEKAAATKYAKDQVKNYKEGGATAIQSPTASQAPEGLEGFFAPKAKAPEGLEGIEKYFSTPAGETPVSGQVLNQVQKESLDLNIPAPKPDVPISVNKNTNNVTKNGKKRANIPLVRNNEETLQRLIFNSTRVV